jgi:hypothetical protein
MSDYITITCHQCYDKYIVKEDILEEKKKLFKVEGVWKPYQREKISGKFDVLGELFKDQLRIIRFQCNKCIALEWWNNGKSK